MFIIGTIGIVAVVIGVMLLMSDEKPAPKNRKPKKKNFFVRLGESGNPKYNWMGGYTESD